MDSRPRRTGRPSTEKRTNKHANTEAQKCLKQLPEKRLQERRVGSRRRSHAEVGEGLGEGGQPGLDGREW